MFIVTEELANMMDETIPNTATLAASSTPETASTSVGIPFETPYPFPRNLNRHGTITAGDTAAIIDPNRKAEINLCFHKFLNLPARRI